MLCLMQQQASSLPLLSLWCQDPVGIKWEAPLLLQLLGCQHIMNLIRCAIFNTSQGILQCLDPCLAPSLYPFWSLTSRPRHWTVFLELLVEPQNAWHFGDFLSISYHPGHPNITIWNLSWVSSCFEPQGLAVPTQSPVEDFISKWVFKKTHLAGFFWCTQFKKLWEMVQETVTKD